MKILMIGNGFDLEHELPTKYTQFLEFVTRFKYAYLSANSVPKRLYDIKDDYLKTIFENPEYEDRVVALHTFTENNVWINYFQKVYKKHLANKENWIDFESEISSMIQTMDGLIKYYEGIAMGDSKNENLEKNYKSKLYNIIAPGGLKEETIKEYIPKLLCDLNKLIGALEIFGHSLDVTDGDVLREFINHENLKTVIFYRNKEQLGQQIANLVKILKSDTVIEKVYGNNPTIIFRQQSKREEIEGSAFEIMSDTMQLENIYRLSHFEAKSLIEKIKSKIDQEDLIYFYSQKAVITLFDVIQKNGLAVMYIKKLLEIARKLMRCDGLQEPEQFDGEYWAYQDYDNSFSCDLLTKKFVNAINLYNKKHFVISEMAIQSYDEQLLEYEKLIKSEEKIDKESYSAIINSIFYMFIDKYGDIEKLWNILLRISRGPGEEVAKDVLKELIENSDDELELIRYNHLLQEIQMNEYFDMQAEEFEKNYEYESGE